MSFRAQPTETEKLYKQVLDIDTRLEKSKAQTESKFDALEDQITAIQRAILDDKELNDELRSHRQQELQHLEDLIATRFD